MALKRKISLNEYSKLSDDIKAEYKSRGDAYVLDLDTSDDDDAIEKLRRSKDAAAEEARKIKEEAAKERIEAEKAREALAKKNGDVAELERHWNEKLAEVETANKLKIEKAAEIVKRTKLDAVAQNIANEVFKGNAKLGLPHVTSRLHVELDSNDEPIVKVLDATGKPSALSLADFKTELLKSDDFKVILPQTEASGGGHARSSVASAGAQNSTKLDQLRPAELAAVVKAKIEQG